MKLADLFIKLGLRKDGFDKGIGDAQKKTTAFGSAVKKIGGMLAGAFAVGRLLVFGKESVRLYDIQAQAESQLLVALKGRRDAQKDLIRQAQQLQGTTLYGDEETIRAQALIAAFVKEKDQIKSIIPLVQDLATAKKMDLAGAADLVSKTLGSSTNALSRYGIEVEGAVGSTQRLESLMDGLNDAFGGQAAAAAEKGAGAIEQLKNTIGDLKEEIGEAVVESRKFPKVLEAIERNAKSFVNNVFFGRTTEEVEAMNKAQEDLESKSTEVLSAIINNDRALKVWANTAKTSVSQIKDAINEIISDRLTGDVGPEPFDFSGGKGFDFPQWEKQLGYTDALRELLKDTKIELDTLMKTGGKFHGEESAEDFIKKVDELSGKINDLTEKLKFKDVPRVNMEELAPRGTSTDELEKFFPDWVSPDSSVLDNMDAFKARINEKLAKLVDAETLEKMKGSFDETEDILDSFNASFISGVSDMLTQVSTALGEAIAGGGWDNFGKAVLQAIGSFLQQMGGLMIAYGIYMALFDSAIKAGPAGWPLAIAAGVGLVAAGAAISSLASGGVSGSGAYSGATASTGGSSASTALSGDVRFVLEGDKLVGAINGSRQRRSITG